MVKLFVTSAVMCTVQPGSVIIVTEEQADGLKGCTELAEAEKPAPKKAVKKSAPKKAAQ